MAQAERGAGGDQAIVDVGRLLGRDVELVAELAQVGDADAQDAGEAEGELARAAEGERGVADVGETSEADIQDDIEFALIQMKAETLSKIDEALARLEEGAYGNCFECGEEISEQRLRALPFAVRCRECEEVRENALLRERWLSQRRGSTSLFLDVSS